MPKLGRRTTQRHRADDRVKVYSLGMKQWLGIAAALLKNPELLILDEPDNGLDAAGVREVGELIRALGAIGVTVLLSSPPSAGGGAGGADRLRARDSDQEHRRGIA